MLPFAHGIVAQAGVNEVVIFPPLNSEIPTPPAWDTSTGTNNTTVGVAYQGAYSSSSGFVQHYLRSFGSSQVTSMMMFDLDTLDISAFSEITMEWSASLLEGTTLGTAQYRVDINNNATENIWGFLANPLLDITLTGGDIIFSGRQDTFSLGSQAGNRYLRIAGRYISGSGQFRNWSPTITNLLVT